MQPTSKLFAIQDAAKELGQSTKSTLYRLLEKRHFNEYLLNEEKRKYLELNSKDKKSLAQKISSNIKR